MLFILFAFISFGHKTNIPFIDNWIISIKKHFFQNIAVIPTLTLPFAEKLTEGDTLIFLSFLFIRLKSLIKGIQDKTERTCPAVTDIIPVITKGPELFFIPAPARPNPPPNNANPLTYNTYPFGEIE